MAITKNFLKHTQKRIENIIQALSENDTETVRKEAHTIKGGAANLSADKLSEIAFELEKIGQSGNLEGGEKVLKRLENEFYRLKKYIVGHLSMPPRFFGKWID